jgi:cyclase
MLKKRIIAALPVKDGIVVQSKQFRQYLPVGSPAIAIEFLNKWGIDEIALIDISARRLGKSPNFDLIKQVSYKCFVPLTVGGGIRTLDDVAELMHCGADKVSLNQALHQDPKLVTAVAKAYGDQCVVASIDAVLVDGAYRVFNYVSQKAMEMSIDDAARQAVDLGAGEILINSVDRDGTYSGYDEALIDAVCQVVNIPVLAIGGAKNAGDMAKVLSSTAASAACAGNFFHFSEHSVNIAKRQAHSNGINLRVDTHASYEENPIGTDGRLLKKDDQTLEKLLYIKVEKEVI